MTTVWADFLNGDDDSGDGSYGNPYKTVYKASTGLTGGDEVRLAKGPDPTALSGTLTWTNDSLTVTTSVDLTGVLAAKDFVGKGTEVWDYYEIASITSDTITLAYKYYGTSESVTSYKLGVIDTGDLASSTDYTIQMNASGSSVSNPLKVTGGWDLATQTQDGFTWYWQSGADRQGTCFHGVSRDYIEIRKFGCCRYMFGFKIYTGYSGDAYSLSSLRNSIQFENSEANSQMNELVVVGQLDPGSYSGIQVSSRTLYVSKITVISCLSYHGFYCFNIAHNCEVDEFIIYGSGSSSSAWLGNYCNCIIGKLDIKYGIDDGLTLDDSGSISIGEAIIENCADYAIVIRYNNHDRFCIGQLSMSNNTLGDIYFYFTTAFNTIPLLRVQRYDNTAHNSRAIGPFGTILKNSSEANGGSGYCLQFDPSDANYYIRETVGMAKISSIASDITLGVYIKDDASFNGVVEAAIYLLGKRITGWTTWTPTTSYVQNTIVASSADLLLDEVLELHIKVNGTDGNVYIDDFGVA
jgi:hypothetical protein